MAPHRIPHNSGIFISDDDRSKCLSSSSAFKSIAEEHSVKNINNNRVHTFVHADNGKAFFPTIYRYSLNAATENFFTSILQKIASISMKSINPKSGLLLPLISLLLFVTTFTQAQVTTLSNWSNVYHGTSNAQTPAYAIPTGSNANRLLVVAIASSQTAVGARTVTLTYGGQTLTSIAGDMATTTTRQHTQLYYLNEAGIDAAGSTTLSITISGGTTRVNDVFAAVYDNVDQEFTITDSKTYNSIAATTTNPVFATALTVDTDNLAIEIISSVRAGNTTPRNITYATNWSLATQQTWTTTDGVRNAVALRALPTATTTDVSSTTLSGATLASMTAMSIKAVPPSSWYSYQSGDWNEPDNWTLDPTGTTLVNPFTVFPTAGDQVTILNGFTITNNLNNQNLNSLIIEGGGILDVGTTTGNNLGEVSGSGLLRVNGVGLPTGVYTNFVAANGGTIEYYNTTGTLPTGQTVYNNLLLSNNSNSPVTFTSANNFTVNNNLNVSQTGGSGTVTWQINDAAATQRTITITGDLTVSQNGLIRAGTGNPTNAHNLTIFGNLTNNGSVKFFDTSFATLSDANYTNGSTYTSAITGRAVNVTFSGLANTVVTCNNQTDFYRLILNKGIGQQSRLSISSTSIANFRLFGPNNLGSSGAAPNQSSNNSLSIVNGTLELLGFITIPNLTQGGGSFPIPQNGTFWINSLNVTVQVTSAAEGGLGGNSRMLFVYGLLRVGNGTLNTGYSRGLLCGLSGQLLVEGGTVNTWQLRTTNAGTGNNFAYTQTGGVVNVGTNGLSGESVTDFPRFALPQATTVFTMSGGTLNVGSPTDGGTATTGGIMINSSAANIKVSGGTVNVFLPTSDLDFAITTNAPLYNLVVQKTGAGASRAIVSGIACNDGAGVINQAAQPLNILNDLTILTGNTPTLDCNGNNLSVGGNLTIQASTTFTPGANTITFNGSGAQTWTHSGTISNLSNVVLTKSAGTITLAGTQTFPNITGTTTGLALNSGTLNDNGKTITVTGALSNNAIHTGAGSIVYNRAGATTIGGGNGIFSNLTIQSDNTVSFIGNHTITGTLRLLNANTSLDISSNSLTVMGSIFSDAATATTFSATKRIITNGLRNDGGLIRSASSGVDLLFPVGSTAIAFTPATINVSATTTGLITVRPVSVTHPNVTTAAQSVRYYWRITSSGFSGISSVVHKDYTYAGATRDAASVNYVPARYDGSTFSWAYGAAYDATAVPGTTTIPNFNTATGWSGLAATRLDGEYTAGNTAAFGTVTVYYSKASANWSLSSTWSNDNVLKHGGANASSAPCATCPVVIGDGATYNHVVVNNANNQTCGSLFIALGSTLDCASATGLNFGVNTSGTGTLRRSTNTFPAGDFTDFIGNGGGTVEYYGNSFTIPTIGPAPQLLDLVNYHNLRISPNTGQTITLPQLSSLTVFNDLTISGVGTGQATTNTTATAIRTVEIRGNLNVLSGQFNIANNGAANAAALIINGNTTINNGASMAVNTTGTAATHTIQTLGSITNNGTLDLNGTGGRVVNLTFAGTSTASLSGSNAGGADFNFITVNKGDSQTPTLTFDMGGTITLLSNNWLTLQNGTLNYNRPTTTVVLTNTATNPYLIPATSKLRAQAGTINISSIGDNGSDLLLAGALEVAGGAVNVGPLATNFNNDIEYASAGTPTIVVSSGTLYVNGSVRRATTSLAGSLVYNQSGGSVTVGGRASENTRGVFEIENNSGSSFTMTGASTLTIARSTGGAAFPDLYLNPSTSNVASSSIIEIGSDALGAQTLDFSITPAIGNIKILGTAGNVQTVNMEANMLTVKGTLTINTPSVLNTNFLDVTIGGDLNILGTGIYNGNNNTTTFNGTGAQTGALTATSNFNNITINKLSGTATLNGTTSITNLNILSGILSNSGALNVNGDIVNSSSQIGTGYIVLTGASSSHSITSSNGSFTNLTLGTGATSKNVTVYGNMTINGILSFATTNRYLTIGSNQLTFSSGASVTGAGANAFVRTNGVASDLGVVRNWPAGNTSFTYPLGTGNSYIPIAFNLNVDALGAGNLTVVPIAQKHPTYNIGSTERILNYYWIVTRGNSLTYSNTGSHVYTYASTLLSGSGGTLVAGLLDIADPDGWITSLHGGAANTTTMTFTDLLSTNLPSAGNTFHYTVGTVNTLPNPIVPVYSRLSNPDVSNLAVGGTWNDLNSWTTDPSGIGAATLGPPIGIPVVILPGSRMNITTNARTAFTSVVNGLLVVGTTTAHNLGTISGTGTLRVATNTFPAGNYNAFVAASGGTIEYVAPMTMNNRSTYNNLSIYSGSTGSVTMTNTDLIINGNVNIPAGTTLNNATNNRNIDLTGNWINGGSFSPGTGTVTLNGSTNQTISGTTSFNRLTVSKATGNVSLTGTGATTVNTNLSLTNGSIISSSSHLLALGTSATITGGGPNALVSGPMTKALNLSGAFAFPVGNATGNVYRPLSLDNTSATDTWRVEYVQQDPSTGGYSTDLINTANLAKVSAFEYWLVSRGGSSAANVTLSYNTGSYQGANIGNVNNLKVAHWDGAVWDLPSGGGTFSQSGDDITGTVSVTNVTNFSPLTLGSTDSDSPLPIELTEFTGEQAGNSIQFNWETASELNNDYFTIERLQDDDTFSAVTTVKGKGTTSELSKYQAYDDAPALGKNYYVLKQTDFNGSVAYSKVIMVEFESVISDFSVYPNPLRSETLHIEIRGLKNGQAVPLRIVSAVGVLITEDLLVADETGTIKSTINSTALKAGVYLVMAGSENPLQKRLVVE